MFKKLFRGIFTAFGMLVGYELFALFNFLAAEEAKTNPDYTSLSRMESIGMGIFFAIIFGIIFYRIAPALGKTGNKMANNIGKDLQSVSANDLLAGSRHDNRTCYSFFAYQDIPRHSSCSYICDAHYMQLCAFGISGSCCRK